MAPVADAPEPTAHITAAPRVGTAEAPVPAAPLSGPRRARWPLHQRPLPPIRAAPRVGRGGGTRARCPLSGPRRASAVRRHPCPLPPVRAAPRVGRADAPVPTARIRAAPRAGGAEAPVPIARIGSVPRAGRAESPVPIARITAAPRADRAVMMAGGVPGPGCWCGSSGQALASRAETPVRSSRCGPGRPAAGQPGPVRSSLCRPGYPAAGQPGRRATREGFALRQQPWSSWAQAQRAPSNRVASSPRPIRQNLPPMHRMATGSTVWPRPPCGPGCGCRGWTGRSAPGCCCCPAGGGCCWPCCMTGGQACTICGSHLPAPSARS